jgi:hypothetical protein
MCPAKASGPGAASATETRRGDLLGRLITAEAKSFSPTLQALPAYSGKGANRVNNLLGQRFTRLTVIARGENSTRGKAQWICECVCGQRTEVTSSSLTSGSTRSCGCLHREGLRERNHKHGHASTRSAEYRCWKGMRDRCNRPSHKDYALYGARGIKVCDRWRVGEDGKHPFKCFLEDMGRRPSSGHSIDRIDTDSPYCPTNCRWATASEQMKNRRPFTQRGSRKITALGRTRTVMQWARERGLNHSTIFSRLRRGWSPEDALSRPLQKHRKYQRRLAPGVPTEGGVMTAVILEFKTTPGKIEVQRDREGWWVFDREIGWRPITEAVARVLNSITIDIEKGSS